MDLDSIGRIYGITGRLVLDERLNTSTIFKRHGRTGFAILSANRSDETKERNARAHEELKKDLEAAGYRYLPVFGGYIGQDGVCDDYEPSFVVFPFLHGKTTTTASKHKWADFGDFFEFVIGLCGKYKQDSILVVKPDGDPHYYDRTGKQVDKASSRRLTINDPNQEYFTSLRDKPSADAAYEHELDMLKARYNREKPSMAWDEYVKRNAKVGRRFTMDIQFEKAGSYRLFSNPGPMSFTESIRRYTLGEVLDISKPFLVEEQDTAVDLHESSITRIMAHFSAHDCATITAFRTVVKDLADNVLSKVKEYAGKRPPKSVQKEWNAELKKTLLRLGYGVTSIKGRWNDKDTGSSDEESWFVVNIHDSKDFKAVLSKLSEGYNQDAFLYVPANTGKAYIIGTNSSDNPGYGKEVAIGTFRTNVALDKEGGMSVVGNKAFAFEGYAPELFSDLGGLSKQFTYRAAASVLNELGIAPGVRGFRTKDSWLREEDEFLGKFGQKRM